MVENVFTKRVETVRTVYIYKCQQHRTCSNGYMHVCVSVQVREKEC